MLSTVFFIAITLAFMTALNTFLNLVAPLILPPIFVEVIHLIDLFLPFDGSIVFPIIAWACSAILSFIIADRVFQLREKIVKGSD